MAISKDIWIECTRCNILKIESEFNKRANVKNKRTSHCKECVSETKKIYRRTKLGVISMMYENQCNHSKSRGHSKPSYKKEWLIEFLMKDVLFHLLFDDWVKSNYNRMLKPSINRKNDFKGYTPDNIELMTWEENDNQGHEDAINSRGTRGARNKKVIKRNIDGSIICKYLSIADASRDTGISNIVIGRTCNGHQKKAGGYKWTYK